VDDDFLRMAMGATSTFLLSRLHYMSGSVHIITCATVECNANKSHSTLVEIIVALNHPSFTEYEWAAADDLMYLFSLSLTPEIEAIYNSQLSNYEVYLEQLLSYNPIPLPDTTTVTPFLVSFI